jgi:MFS family permease
VTRSRRLGFAAEIAGVGAVLEAAERLVGLFDRSGTANFEYSAADTLAFIAALVLVFAFFVASTAFQRLASPGRRPRTLSTAAGLVAVAAVIATTADFIRTIESAAVHAPWKFTLTEVAFTGGWIALAAAAVLAAIGFSASTRDALLGRASLGVAAYAGLFALGSGIELAEVLGFRAPLGWSYPWQTTFGIGVIVGGWSVLAVAGVLAAAAFRDAGLRRARGDAWKASREGMLARAATVGAAGFAVSAVGFAVEGSAGDGTLQWLSSLSDLGFAAAAGCAGMAFLESRRRLQQSDGAYLAVPPDPA